MFWERKSNRVHSIFPEISILLFYTYVTGLKRWKIFCIKKWLLMLGGLASASYSETHPVLDDLLYTVAYFLSKIHSFSWHVTNSIPTFYRFSTTYPALTIKHIQYHSHIYINWIPPYKVNHYARIIRINVQTRFY